jgi:hypothetical protein
MVLYQEEKRKTVPVDFEPLLYFIDLFIESVEFFLFRLLPGEPSILVFLY